MMAGCGRIYTVNLFQSLFRISRRPKAIAGRSVGALIASLERTQAVRFKERQDYPDGPVVTSAYFRVVLDDPWNTLLFLLPTAVALCNIATNTEMDG